MNRAIKIMIATTAVWLVTWAMTVPGLAADNAKVAGDWALTVESPNGTGTPTVTFKQDGETLSGTYKGRFGETPVKGTIKGKELKFSTTINPQGQDIQLEFSGTIDGDSVKGTVKFGDAAEGTFSGKKKGADAPLPK